MPTTTVTPSARRAHAHSSVATSAARATTSPSARPDQSDAQGPEELRRALDVVRPAPKRPVLLRGRVVLVAPVLVLVSLLAVADAQAMLTQGQVRLSNLQAEVSAAQTKRFGLELQIAREEQPSAVIAAARAQGMIVPSVINDLPAVSLVSPRPAKQPSKPSETPSNAAKNGSASNRVSGHP